MNVHLGGERVGGDQQRGHSENRQNAIELLHLLSP
jgi:hypothetical protein